jgi:hypothetical protein
MMPELPEAFHPEGYAYQFGRSKWIGPCPFQRPLRGPLYSGGPVHLLRFVLTFNINESNSLDS